MVDPVIRLLDPHEAGRLCGAVREVYGTTYPHRWIYNEREVANRITHGTQVSAIAEMDGTLVCHAGLAFHHPQDRVGHAGQAVTLPAARGHHLFTATKAHLAREATARGLIGMYSEATAAHPYSQRANVELGAQETGFLLGYISSSVDNSVNGRLSHRQSAALFYLRTNRSPAHPAYVPQQHRDMVLETFAACQFHARLAEPSHNVRVEPKSTLHTGIDAGANLAVVTVAEPGGDLQQAAAHTRDRLFAHGYDVMYLDLPLELPATAVVVEPLHEVGLSFAGVFPNSRCAGDVLRLQSVRSGTVASGDATVASDHGRVLLEYVIEDLRRAGHTVHTDRSAEEAARQLTEDLGG